MTFYQAVRTLKAKGYIMIKQYSTCEIWEKGTITLSIPNLPNLPKGLSDKIKKSI